VKEVIRATIVGIDFFLALLATLLAKDFLEGLEVEITRITGRYAPVMAWMLSTATFAPLGAVIIIMDVYFCPVTIMSNDQIRIIPHAFA
jgi:hypothetical protein